MCPMLYAALPSSGFNCSPRVLWFVGLSCIGTGSLISILTGLSIPFWPPDEVLQLQQETWQPPPAAIEEEVATNLKPYLQQLPARSFEAFFLETFLFLYLIVWRCSGLMLIGMALSKQQVLTGERSVSFYILLAGIAACIGIPLTMYGVHLNFMANWSMSYSFFLGDQFNYWASLLISLAYTSAIMLIFKLPALANMAWPIARVGQMALSNYLLQTLICTLIFYGHGLAQFGNFSRTDQAFTVLAVWMVQTVISCIWLHYFRFGPIEWLWRSLTYWQRQPLRVHI